ncbi:dihydroxy-acid dehydratase [Streptomyces umbrinus]|uniref:dihydroxy-acid dehydratase n=1 Tax=Streptomyces umbrinus TaxID=67370 RepID=UPI0019A2933B|nr:dihydroxy-acid dehydratase [Streptomyces umbrinus]MCR3724434.1 dihydroxy-acid dehydratase [Streptomyces umbrinus]MCX4563442.1 dihydroxy-acid dehydratase [Streptomyces phaeochromogenes]GHB68178.1 dihydroxy-acid dehydratase [Streptomyces umbrinus]GHH51516.1 dihydroxy-acid dehydratase [Streptomyces umbrinus]
MVTLRSAQWYAGQDRNAYIHRAWMRRGVPGDAFEGRPQIAIANTASDLTPCNAHLNEVAASVRNGVYEAGGIPLDLPVVSLGETQVRPTAMLWRNMAAMATEEMLRANPIDGVVLLGGCDKTIPSLLMAAASVDLPAVVVPGGPMLTGTFRGTPLGCGTDVWRLSEEVRAGTLSQEQFTRSESAMIRSRGHCNTMGTASTMALVAEALGTVVPGVAGTPAPDSRLLEAAHGTGRLAVDMVAADRRPGTFLTKASFHNAIVALAAIGGSTNAVVHLLAIAGRLGIELSLDDFDRIGSRVPVLVDLQPAGRFLMEDFHRAGGLSAVLREVRDLLDPDALTVTGEPLVNHLDDAPIWDGEVIRTRAEPLVAEGGIAVLRGNLAPDGALIKPAAASAHLLRHRGRAVVFDSIEDFHARIDDPDLDVDADSVLVLRGCGPKGYPGMPEVANMPLPKKLLEQGVRDMVRVCDGRMSGTAYGTVVLHVAPEAAAGGPLALARTGDHISLDVPARRIDLDVPADELARRTPTKATVTGFASPRRGWERLYVDHVLQADTGADLDFLVGSSGSEVSRESH